MLNVFTWIPSQSFSELLCCMISSTRNLPENLEGQILNGHLSQSISLSVLGRQLKPSGMHKGGQSTFRNWRLFIPSTMICLEHFQYPKNKIIQKELINLNLKPQGNRRHAYVRKKKKTYSISFKYIKNLIGIPQELSLSRLLQRLFLDNFSTHLFQ